MQILTIALQILLTLTSLFLVLLILMQKGKGGGMSDMFGGSMSASMGGSSYAAKNLQRFTIGMGLLWLATIVALGVLVRFS
ncbi:MAG: preprotein translocase subunit SecG [Mobilicoccus sp.]|nr:preprotein translocase subunit SecG [Mobilicoccus sp.]